jgi:hypothetical protein
VATKDYPGFLGRKRDGVVEGIELESDWNAHPPQLLWRQPIGLGWSAFAAAHGPIPKIGVFARPITVGSNEKGDEL